MIKQGHNLLLVDDNPDDRYRIYQAFADLHWADHVKIFSGGEDLLHYLRNLTDLYYPSLVALEYNMNGMNGGELLFHLKKDNLLTEIPVVVYTSGLKTLLAEKLLALGAHSCLEKGGDYQDLTSLAARLKTLSEELIQI